MAANLWQSVHVLWLKIFEDAIAVVQTKVVNPCYRQKANAYQTRWRRFEKRRQQLSRFNFRVIGILFTYGKRPLVCWKDAPILWAWTKKPTSLDSLFNSVVEAVASNIDAYSRGPSPRYRSVQKFVRLCDYGRCKNCLPPLPSCSRRKWNLGQGFLDISLFLYCAQYGMRRFCRRRAGLLRFAQYRISISMRRV